MKDRFPWKPCNIWIWQLLSQILEMCLFNFLLQVLVSGADDSYHLELLRNTENDSVKNLISNYCKNVNPTLHKIHFAEACCCTAMPSVLKSYLELDISVVRRIFLYVDWTQGLKTGHYFKFWLQCGSHNWIWLVLEPYVRDGSDWDPVNHKVAHS